MMKVKEVKAPIQREDLLICKDGFINLSKGGKVIRNLENHFPDNYASFQLNRKLYICGGSFFKDGVIKVKPTFSSINYFTQF